MPSLDFHLRKQDPYTCSYSCSLVLPWKICWMNEKECHLYLLMDLQLLFFKYRAVTQLFWGHKYFSCLLSQKSCFHLQLHLCFFGLYYWHSRLFIPNLLNYFPIFSQLIIVDCFLFHLLYQHFAFISYIKKK